VGRGLRSRVAESQDGSRTRQKSKRKETDIAALQDVKEVSSAGFRKQGEIWDRPKSTGGEGKGKSKERKGTTAPAFSEKGWGTVN